MFSKKCTQLGIFGLLAVGVLYPFESHADFLFSSSMPTPMLAFSNSVISSKPVGSVMTTSGHTAHVGRKLEVKGYADTDSYASLIFKNPDGSLTRLMQNQFIHGGTWRTIAPSDGHTLFAVEPLGRTEIILILSTSPIKLALNISKSQDLERSLQQIPNFSYNIITSHVDVVR